MKHYPLAESEREDNMSWVQADDSGSQPVFQYLAVGESCMYVMHLAVDYAFAIHINTTGNILV